MPRVAHVGPWLPGLFLYAILAAYSAREVGLVGEVAIGWGTQTPPVVLAQLDPPSALAPPALGFLAASQTRPVERLELGSGTRAFSVPLAINAYTGGASDLPARVVASVGGWRAGAWVGVVLGGLLLALAARFLTFHAGSLAAGLVAVLLATDWSFVFYKRVLSGTEVLLQAGGLLAVWALWSRRWRGGVHGTVGIALGAAFGLHAKATFVPTLLAIALAALLTRRDRPALAAPAPLRWAVLLMVPLLALSPLLLANWHATLVPEALRVRSHDTLALQLSRLSLPGSGSAMARESFANLAAFFGDPNAFWSWALHADAVSAFSWGRGVGFVVLGCGTWLAWADRRGAPSPSDALLRFFSVLCPFQTGLLFLANHDLHHLAQASVFWCIWLALAIARVTAVFARARTLRRVVLAACLMVPTGVAGARQLLETDEVLKTAPQSTFRESGQEALLAMLADAKVQRLVTSDYEVYGMIDVRAPWIATTHTWAAFSRKVPTPAGVLRLARGAHYLSLRPTAPMIYNWSPNPAQVVQAATSVGVKVREVGQLSDDAGVWASLWAVE
jgi:hypothetical protein